MKIAAAAVQMTSIVGEVDQNLDRAIDLVDRAHGLGAELVVLPEMFNTGYGLVPDYAPFAEGRDGPTIRALMDRARVWGLSIAAGFVESDGEHLYDSLVLVEPGRAPQVYRKRNLVFWEPFRFRAGRAGVIADSRFGRVGLAICADMIHGSVWTEFRGRVDLALIAAAWPEFACRESGRRHWLFGHVGPISGVIPHRAAVDLGVPVVFANQSGATETRIPILGTRIKDRFAGFSSLTDGRHGPPRVLGLVEDILIGELTIHPRQGPSECRTTTFDSGLAATSSGSGRSWSPSWAGRSIDARPAGGPGF